MSMESAADMLTGKPLRDGTCKDRRLESDREG